MLISILGAQTFNPGNWHNQFKVALGLDLSSGTQVVLKAATPNGAVPSAQAMQASVGVLENRVNGTGNSGAQVQTQGNDQITVTVPGKAATSVVNLIDTTARLAFRPVLLSEAYTGASTAPAAKATGTPSPTPSGTASGTATPTGSPTPSVGSSPSATAKASTSDVSAKLASSPTATPTGTASAKATTKTSTSATATPTASATPSGTASANPGATASTSTTFGNPSAVSAATMKKFDALVCKPGPNAVHRERQLEEHRPRVHRRPFPVGQRQGPDRLLRRVRQQVRARAGRGSGHRDLLGRCRP